LKYLSKCPSCDYKKIFKYCTQRLTENSNSNNLSDAENQTLLRKLKLKSLNRSIYLCRSCFLLFQNPTYDAQELELIYGDMPLNGTSPFIDEKHFEKDCWPLLRKKYTSVRQKRYARVIRFYKKSKILDYGGGIGTNLLDPSLNSLKRFVYDFGKDSTPEEGIIPIKSVDNTNRFDFILHTHVLEHEPDPFLSLRQLRESISPGGILYLEVPFEYTERILTRRPGAVWHVNYFNRKSIIALANKSGWKCQSLQIFYLPYGHFFINCLIAVMESSSNESIPLRSINNVQVLYDMGRSMINRLILGSFRKLNE
jgi:hypothetical protein